MVQLAGHVFFFNDTATTEIYTLSLHDALPISSLSSVVARLANRLQRRLLAQQNRAWTFDFEEGMLDTARLTRVVVDPTSPLSFKQEEDAPFLDTVVTLLIDNSGSRSEEHTFELQSRQYLVCRLLL